MQKYADARSRAQGKFPARLGTLRIGSAYTSSLGFICLLFNKKKGFLKGVFLRYTTTLRA
jgi:hypothetical protein